MDFAKAISDLVAAPEWSVFIYGGAECILDLSVVPGCPESGYAKSDNWPIGQERVALRHLAESFEFDSTWLSLQFDSANVPNQYRVTRLAEALQTLSNCLNKQICGWCLEEACTYAYGCYAPCPIERSTRVEDLLRNIVRQISRVQTPLQAIETVSSYYLMWPELIMMCRPKSAKEWVQELEFTLCGYLHATAERHGREAVEQELKILLGHDEREVCLFVLCAQDEIDQVRFASHDYVVALGKRLPRHVYDILEDYALRQPPRYSSLPNT